MSGNNQEAKIYAVTGSSGGGKSTHMLNNLRKKKRRRTLFWSPKEAIDNYAGFYPGSVICTTATEVLNILKAAGRKGEFHIVFRPPAVRAQAEKLFHVVCKMVLVARDTVFIADELHTVTRPGWAPDGWSELVMMGRGYGIEVWGLSQRPASMDKDFLGNASTIHTRRLSLPADAETLAKAIGVRPAEMLNLSGFMWIERNNLTGNITKG